MANLQTAMDYVSALVGNVDQQNMKSVAVSPIEKSIVMSDETDKEMNDLQNDLKNEYLDMPSPEVPKSKRNTDAPERRMSGNTFGKQSFGARRNSHSLS